MGASGASTELPRGYERQHGRSDGCVGRNVDAAMLREGLERAGRCCSISMCLKASEVGRTTCAHHGNAQGDRAQAHSTPPEPQETLLMALDPKTPDGHTACSALAAACAFLRVGSSQETASIESLTKQLAELRRSNEADAAGALEEVEVLLTLAVDAAAAFLSTEEALSSAADAVLNTLQRRLLVPVLRKADILDVLTVPHGASSLGRQEVLTRVGRVGTPVVSAVGAASAAPTADEITTIALDDDDQLEPAELRSSLRTTANPALALRPGALASNLPNIWDV